MKMRSIPGFTFIEITTAVALIAIGIVAIVSLGKDSIDGAKVKLAEANAAEMNSVMAEYRSYRKQGYLPPTAWAAETSADVFVEMRKPLIKGSKKIILLRGDQYNEVVAAGLVRARNRANTADDFTSACYWFVAPGL